MTTRAPSHTHTHTYKLQKDQGCYSQQLHSSMLTEEAAEKLLSYNNSEWTDEVSGNFA